MTTEYYPFTELNIEPAAIEELMGFEPGHAPAPFPELIQASLIEAAEFCQVVGGFRIFDQFLVDPSNESFIINDKVFFPGKTVITHLQKATKAALFLCSAGTGISELYRKKVAQGDDLTAYVLDVIGSVTVKKAAALIQDWILKEFSPSGYGITDSFSPGNFTWSIADQQKLFSLLPYRFCNIYLTKSHLMHPAKSLSGITGIGLGCQQTGNQCIWCNVMDCIYEKVRCPKKAKKNL